MRKLNKNLIGFFLALVILVGFVKVSFAEESASSSAEVAKKYGFIFPIIDLGNCNSISECKNYCEISTNHDACFSFARRKGFYKPRPKKEERVSSESATQNDRIIEAAKAVLGCATQDACRQFCSMEQNWIKCGEFAKAYKLGSPKPPILPGNATSSAQQIMSQYCSEHPDQCNTGPNGPVINTALVCKQNPEICNKIREAMQKINPEKPAPSLSPSPHTNLDTSNVRGASTQRGFVQRLLNWLGIK